MIGILVKNRLRSLVGTVLGKSKGGEVKKASKAKMIGFAILYIYVAIVFFAFSAGAAVFLGKTLIPIGASWLYFAYFMIASVSIIFIFSIFETKSELFECKDNELLLSMPIKPSDIALSRVSVVLIYNYIETLFVMLPCIVVYAIYSHDMIGVIGATIASLFLPVIATSLACAVGYLVSILSQKIGKNSFVTVFIALVFIFVYFIGYNYVIDNFNAYIEKLAETGVMPDEMPLLYHIGAVALLKPINLLVFIFASLMLGVLSYSVISSTYIKLLTVKYSAKKIEYTERYIKAKSQLRALTEKELKRFFSSAIYMLNGALGLVFLVVLSVLALIKKGEISEISGMIFLEFGLPSESLSLIFIIGMLVISSINMISLSSVSLEGKCLWIPKTMPLDDAVLLKSKALAHMVITAPPTLIASILFAVASGAGAEYWFFYITIPQLANLVSAFFGLIVNIAFPKFDFDNEAQVIKQSMASFVGLMTQMLVTVAVSVGAVALLFRLSPIFVTLLCFLLFVLLTVISYLVLMNVSKRKYASFNA